MNNSFCSICEVTFSFDNVPKVLKNCNHSVCCSCLRKEKVCAIDNQPIDLQKYGIKNYLTNTHILQQLRLKSNQKSHIDKQICKINQYSQLQRPITQQQNCLLHSKPADVICFQQGILICSTCALFGQHKGHKILSYGQLLKNVSEVAEDALTVYDTIKTKQQSLSMEVIKQYIQNEFKQKRNTQAKNIRQMFQRTIQRLRKIQKATVSNLDVIISRTMKTLKESVNCSDMKQKISQWYMEVQKLGNIAQDVYCYKSINEALRYLSENCQQSFLCKKGQYLSIQVTALQATIKNKIDQQVQSSNCIFNTKLIDQIDDFCKFQQRFKTLLKQNEQKKNKIFSGFTILQKYSQIKQNQDKLIDRQRLQIQNQDILLDTQSKYNQQTNYNQLNILSESIIQKKSYLGFNQSTYPANSLQNSIVYEISSLNLKSFQELDQINLKQTTKNVKMSSRNASKSKILNKSNKKYQKQNENYTQSIKTRQICLQFSQKQNQVLKNISQNHQIKRKKKVQIPEKYKNLWEQIKNDKLDQIDLTGAQLGNLVIISLAQSLSKTTKTRQVKLIRNKLTDQIMHDLLCYLRSSNITNINLSQNGFTQKSLQMIEHYDLGNLKTITLSLNKINGRKVKDRLQALRQRGVIVSI